MMQNFLARMGDASVRGALFMSAGSTLPIHLMPMIIDGMRKDNMSGALAGGVLGAFLLGFCTVAAALPLLGIKNITQRWGWLALAMLPLWVLASANLHPQALLLPWFGVGLTCGALQCMANLMVADAPDKHVAFSARLAVTLVGNGLIALLLQLLGGFAGPFEAIRGVALGIALSAAVGLPWYRLKRMVQAQHAKMFHGMATGVGLVGIALMFAGLHGFTAFAFSHGEELGFDTPTMVWCLIAVKIAAGSWALYLLARPWGFQGSMWVSGGLTLAGLVLLQFGSNLPLFFAGLLLREFGLNALSARFLATVTNTNPSVVAPWLALFMFGGSASGPLLRGLSMDHGVPLAFSVFAFAVCLVPAAYAMWLHRKGTRMGVPV